MLKIYGNINIVLQITIEKQNRIKRKLLVFQGSQKVISFFLYNTIREICQITKEDSRFQEEKNQQAEKLMFIDKEELILI